MRLLLSIAAFSALIVGAVGLYGFGAHLPETRAVSAKAVYRIPAEHVWQTIGEMPAPMLGMQGAKRLGDEEGHPVWRLTDAKGRRVDLTLIDQVPGKTRLIRVLRSDLPFVANRQFELEPHGDATLVTLNEECYVASPLWRLIRRSIHAEEREAKRTLESIGESLGDHPHIVSGT